jgi:hypothetical protein
LQYEFELFCLDDKNGTSSTEGEAIKVESNETKPEEETKEKAPKEEVPILELPGEASEEKATSDEVKSEETDKDKGQCCFLFLQQLSGCSMTHYFLEHIISLHKILN